MTIRQQLRELDLEGETEVLVPMGYIVGLLNEIDTLNKNVDRLSNLYNGERKRCHFILAQSVVSSKCGCNHKRLDIKG